MSKVRIMRPAGDLVLLFLVVFILFLLCGTEAKSADYSIASPDYFRGGVCYDFNLQHPGELHKEISVRVRDYFEEANTVVVSAQQSSIDQLRFDWALEARDWCGVALGYMKEGVWDNEAVNRCLCFREYMREY
ncbi:hypothetical protein GCM10007094_26090 [Pseudovibrio japonicus]|uniref:Lipoprotein n=1 Tax=Pseudovibrio japonicus TaxID=366534 RepID=A0ABQ3EEE5_9HYPH|nr:hypothetical protein [Pseudovibrio japonicus]GHB35341.1 hypothetical protein GCM10007094_26090 [Pseudovibrio japonicus]